ncbi:MAG: hypothetical protein AB7P04_13305 [Bacteriovoracia bacterium]
MSRTFQVTYPAAIFTAALASAGMGMIPAQGGNPGYILFPEHNPEQTNHTLASTDAMICSDQSDHFPSTNSPRACTDKNDWPWRVNKDEPQSEYKPNPTSSRLN